MTMKKQKGHRAARQAGKMADADVEFAINELAAEQAAIRLVLQSFLLRLFAVKADAAPAALAELQDHVSRSIAAIPLARDDQVGAARWKKLVAASAEKLLGEISDTIKPHAAERVQ
jgi:hypothetical protein